MRLADAQHVDPSAGSPAAQVLAAIHGGSPILCGRPVTSDLAVANEIRDAGILSGVPVLASLPFLFHPQHRYALDLLRNGAIGRLTEVRVQATSAVLPEHAESVTPTADPWIPAAYVVAAVRSIVGAAPSRVIGWGEMDAAGRDTGFAGTFFHADGVTASVAWSTRPGYGAGYVLIGTEGVIEVPNAFLAAGDELRAQAVVLLRGADDFRIGRGFPEVDAYALMVEELVGASSSVDEIVAVADTFDLVRIASGRPCTLAQRGQQWNLSPSA